MKNYKQYTDSLSNCAYPPGHYYSPVPSIAEIKQNEREIFKLPTKSIAGIDLNIGKQLNLINSFKPFYNQLPFSPRKQSKFRYYYDNPYYSYGDAISLYCMLRFLQPKRIIEVGSGFSSAVTLDVREHFLDKKLECTFIEPYPERLQSLLKQDDRVKLISARLQDVTLDAQLNELENNDILFIDSTHVSKTGNDVNKLYLDTLPNLNSGVYIHIHDIFYPFEYPKEWVFEGRAWNEIYLLKAFLQFNSKFEIIFFNHMLATLHPDKLYSAMPLYKNNPGGSIWLRKL
jgi:hypothetical protein